MPYRVETFVGGELLVDVVPGPPPDVMHHLVIDGRRWRVLVVEHRIGDAPDRLPLVVAIVEADR